MLSEPRLLLCLATYLFRQPGLMLRNTRLPKSKDRFLLGVGVLPGVHLLLLEHASGVFLNHKLDSPARLII
jgi:hypothetical protein